MSNKQLSAPGRSSMAFRSQLTMRPPMSGKNGLKILSGKNVALLIMRGLVCNSDELAKS